MANWIEPPEIYLPDEIQHLVGGHPLVAQTLIRRGFSKPSEILGFLDPKQYLPASPYEFSGMLAAVERLELALTRQETICVWGDFDVDGQTATALLVSGLRRLAAQVVFHIPVRARQSHGVQREFLERVLAGEQDVVYGWYPGAGPVSLLLTCDTGVSAHEALQFAEQMALDVIVTDHHELPETLPPALVILNPRNLPNSHPLASLPGVGVAYKLIEALYGRLGLQGELEAFLDLVALGIVADVALQTADTRWLLQRGLGALRQTPRAGLLALFELAELNLQNINEEHIAFELAPRLNALGRLGDANLAVEFLITQDRARARSLAEQLDAMNNQRKLETSLVFQGALSMLDREPRLVAEPLIVLNHPAWPPAVLGIVASRLIERFHKPVALIASPPGKPARGSARSVAGINIVEALRASAGLLDNFGGHAMAAGFSLAGENVPAFQRALSRNIRKQEALPEPVVPIDGFVTLGELSLILVDELERLAPFGPGNPPVTLAARDLHILESRTVGRANEHILITVEDSAGSSQPVIWWQGTDWPQPQGTFDLAFSLRSTTYRSQRALQAVWIDYRQVVGDTEFSLSSNVPQLVDYRQIEHPVPILIELNTAGGLQVWAEGQARSILASEGLPVRTRAELAPGPGLAIWTGPPGPTELAAALQQVRPEKVYLLAFPAETDRLDEFLNRLVGMVKYAIRNKDGQVKLEQLAAGTAQRTLTVRKGLDWLAFMGHIVTTEADPETFTLESGGTPDSMLARQVATELEMLLEESRAYRAYFARADGNSLLRNGVQ